MAALTIIAEFLDFQTKKILFMLFPLLLVSTCLSNWYRIM